jgi:hypothetical protein
LSDLSTTGGLTVVMCSGFWEGNANGGGSAVAQQNAALLYLGAATPYTQLEHLALGQNALFIDFARMLYGVTIVSFHWGNGQPAFDNANPKLKGGGSAFYRINAGTAGIDKIYFGPGMNKSISNGVLWQTGRPDGGGGPQEVVPEPATMTLLATGLAGMAAASRRRRKNA